MENLSAFMESSFVGYFLLLLNLTAAKCALGPAIIVAPLWVFIVEPLLCRIRNSRKISLRLRSPSTTRRRGQEPAAGEKNVSNRKHVGAAVAAASVSSSSLEAPAILRRHATPGPDITNEALVGLVQSPGFVRWYNAYRVSLLERVRTRCAQRLWESLAVMVVLLMATFLVPFFGLSNERATLWGLLQRRSEGKGNAAVTMKSDYLWDTLCNVASGACEPLLVLVAVLTLLTTSFMPANAKETTSVALVAFIVLVVVANEVERMAFGAGFLMMLGVLVWRISCTLV